MIATTDSTSSRTIDYSYGGTDDTGASTSQPSNHGSAVADGVPQAFAGRANRRQRPAREQERAAVLGVGDPLGTGDSYLVEDILPEELAEVAFERMRNEVKWNTMYHRGKLELCLVRGSFV